METADVPDMANDLSFCGLFRYRWASGNRPQSRRHWDDRDICAPVRHRHIGRLWNTTARGLAIFIGGFSLLNLAGELRHPGFDANLWWIDLRPLGPAVAHGFLGIAGALLLAYGIKTPQRMWRRAATGLATVMLLILTGANAVAVRTLASQGEIATNCPVAFSLLMVIALAWILTAAWVRSPSAHPARKLEVSLIALTVAACLVGFPLAQMYCFGMTDYRRPADAVVVFGARVYADGRVSHAVADRVRTGCSLYQEGLARRLILSGGPGDGAIHETEGMRRIAVRLGVPDEAILLDEQGLNTQATVRNTSDLFDRHGLRRVLAVSHFYHLPRVKLTYQRYGREVYTVPSRESYRLTALPIYMMREVAALWMYYARPLWE